MSKKLKLSHSYDRFLNVETKTIYNKLVKLESKCTYQTKQ